MLRIVLGNTSVSIPPAMDDDWEIPYRSAKIAREAFKTIDLDTELIVHTADDRCIFLQNDTSLASESEFAGWTINNSLSGGIHDLLDGPLVVMTQTGDRRPLKDLSVHLEDATVLIGGFRVGDFDNDILGNADHRISLGPKLLPPWVVVVLVIEAWRYASFRRKMNQNEVSGDEDRRSC